MAVSQLSGREEGDFQVNLTNCNFGILVIGHGNTVNNYCRRLEYGEQSTPSRSRGTGLRTTAIRDGGNVVEQRESTVESRVRSDIPSKNTDQILDCAQKEAPARVRKSLLGTIRQKSFRSLRVILYIG